MYVERRKGFLIIEKKISFEFEEQWGANVVYHANSGEHIVFIGNNFGLYIYIQVYLKLLMLQVGWYMVVVLEILIVF